MPTTPPIGLAPGDSIQLITACNSSWIFCKDGIPNGAFNKTPLKHSASYSFTLEWQASLSAEYSLPRCHLLPHTLWWRRRRRNPQSLNLLSALRGRLQSCRSKTLLLTYKSFIRTILDYHAPLVTTFHPNITYRLIRKYVTFTIAMTSVHSINLM